MLSILIGIVVIIFGIILFKTDPKDFDGFAGIIIIVVGIIFILFGFFGYLENHDIYSNECTVTIEKKYDLEELKLLKIHDKENIYLDIEEKKEDNGNNSYDITYMYTLKENIEEFNIKKINFSKEALEDNVLISKNSTPQLQVVKVTKEKTIWTLNLLEHEVYIFFIPSKDNINIQ